MNRLQRIAKMVVANLSGNFVWLFSADFSSYGSHGSGPNWQDNERPARPFNEVNGMWEFNENLPKFESLLKGLPVVLVVYNEGGSYHERWKSIAAYVEIPDGDILYKFEDEYGLDRLPESRRTSYPRSLSMLSNYTSLDKTIVEAVTRTNVSLPSSHPHLEHSKEMAEGDIGPNAPRPGETSERYWQRMMREKSAGLPRENKWEGD